MTSGLCTAFPPSAFPTAARAAFEKLAPSHRKAIAGYVAEAKQEETRERRATQTLEQLASGTWKPR
jgi:uncharacterized protein YdeI (YjbR/CyaY-like superfamily)